MLRRLIALMLLAAMGFGFYYWSYVKKDFNETVNSLIDELSIQVDANETENAKATVGKIKDIYSDKESIYSMLTDHEFLNVFSDHVSEIESAMKTGDHPRLDTAIITLKNHVNDFYKDNKVSLSTIL